MESRIDEYDNRGKKVMERMSRAFIKEEKQRQADTIELIASENFVSAEVKKAMGSCLTNKYSEGYPEQKSIDRFKEMFPDYIHTGNVGRYYGGCDAVDMNELYCRYMWQKVFRTQYHVNVQPHSGTQANMAAYAALLNPGDTVLSMSLENGAHLSHGSPVSFSGKTYNFIHYGVTENGYIDYDDLYRKAVYHKPKMIVAGASAYPRHINFKIIRDFCDECGALFMVDMAHIAGLVAAGYHQNPMPFADIVTTTTHKTLRGPRGGMILCKPCYAKAVDSAVFPMLQGGPLQNIIAAKAVCAEEALELAFKEYIERVVKNCGEMAMQFKNMGYKLVTNGTENHLVLIDFSETHPNITGQMVQEALDAHNITVNKNMVPWDRRSPKETSGIRIGAAAMTARGYTAQDFIETAIEIDEIIRSLAR